MIDILSFRQAAVLMYRKSFEKLLLDAEMTQMEMDILLFLANNPQYNTAKEIIEIRYLTKSHVSSSVEKLVQRGFLSRFQDENNQKLIHLHIQQTAWPWIEQGRTCQQQFTDLLLEGFSCEDRRKLQELFGIIHQNFQHALNNEKEGK